MPAPYRHFAFDFDGTLVDSLHAKADNAGGIFAARYGVDAGQVVRRYHFHSGIARRLLFERIAQDVLGRGLFEPEYVELDAAFTAQNLQTVSAAPAQPGVPEVLAELHRRGAHMAVSSSAPEHDLLPRVARSGLVGFFEAVLPSRDGFRKGPDHVAHLRALWQAEAASCLSVGDEVADARLADEAGIDCALVTHTITAEQAQAAHPRHVLTSFDQLLTLTHSRPTQHSE